MRAVVPFVLEEKNTEIQLSTVCVVKKLRGKKGASADSPISRFLHSESAGRLWEERRECLSSGDSRYTSVELFVVTSSDELNNI